MPDEPEPDLEARVSALESTVVDLTRRVQRSEHDAAAARVLAGGADRDVSEIRAEIRDFRRATTSGFTAMRADFVDLRGEFADLRTHVDRNFLEVRSRLDGAAAGQAHIVELLTTLIERDDGSAAGGQAGSDSG